MDTRSAPAASSRLLWLGLGAALLIIAAGALRVLIGTTPLGRITGGAAAGPLPVYGTVPDFSLTERTGRLVTRAQLQGSIWIADFIFTRCGSICPALTAQMSRLRAKLPPGGQRPVRLVSVSVDPAWDTPAVLRDYAARYHADETWLFLTGERPALEQLIREGFQVALEQRPGDAAADPNELITHSSRFVLVDGAFQIRGYYSGTEDTSVGNLLRDIATLQAEG